MGFCIVSLNGAGFTKGLENDVIGAEWFQINPYRSFDKLCSGVPNHAAFWVWDYAQIIFVNPKAIFYENTIDW